MRGRVFKLLLTCAAALACPAQILAQRAPEQDYLVYVVSESADKISLVRFGPKGAKVERTLGTGVMPTDVDGPHGVAVSPDKKFYYVSLGHGRPFGSVWKYAAADDKVVGQVTLGLFPATMDVSPDGEFRLRRQLQFARRHDALLGLDRRRRRDAGGRAHPDLHHAARLALQPAGDEALFRVHDGRHAGRD